MTLIPRAEQWQYRDFNKDTSKWKQAAFEAARESGEDEFSRDLNALVFEQSYTLDDQTRLLDDESVRETKDELDRLAEIADMRSRYNQDALAIQKSIIRDGPEFMAKIDRDPNTGMSTFDIIELNRKTVSGFMDRNLIQRQAIPTYIGNQNYNPFGEIRASEL